ncbi:MAG: flagellar basal body L-ring protein FlgH [Rickettsiales bacterium]|nr:flagellar basal body L-ring protein FlgH [Rickettsiales bacterium]
MPQKLLYRALFLLATGTLLSSCAATLDKLEEVGSPPDHTIVENPTQKIGYQPMTWPAPDPEPPSRQYSNSLWQPGARAFFRDQRASRVGDILRVRVEIDDEAQLVSNFQRQRRSGESVEAPAVFGLENDIPFGADPNQLLDITANTNSNTIGRLNRQDKVETQVSAVILQLLANGNYVIEGTQEVRVNNDIRELKVGGIVRPQDIDSTNTVDSSQIAEARITYGGRGVLTRGTQQRWGTEVLDILSPF